jgi:hypothetical protein
MGDGEVWEVGEVGEVEEVGEVGEVWEDMTPSHLLTPPYTSSHLLTPPYTSSHLLIPPHTSLYLLTPPYTSLHLLTPPYTSSAPLLSVYTQFQYTTAYLVILNIISRSSSLKKYIYLRSWQNCKAFAKKVSSIFKKECQRYKVEFIKKI